MPGTLNTTLNVIDLEQKPYHSVWKLQQSLFQKRLHQKFSDILLLVEHPPVYTIGRRGTAEHILISQKQLREQGIEVIKSDRGGEVTFHGPGQLIAYNIFDLRAHKKDISWYLWALEEIGILTLKHWKIMGQRISGLTGVWVENQKIMSVGIRMSKWVTMHGIALNVAPDLGFYNGIIPCGITNRGVTSMNNILGRTVSMSDVKLQVLHTYQRVFNYSEWKITPNDYLGKDEL